jgi:hypothetical protein
MAKYIYLNEENKYLKQISRKALRDPTGISTIGFCCVFLFVIAIAISHLSLTLKIIFIILNIIFLIFSKHYLSLVQSAVKYKCKLVYKAVGASV